MNNKIPWYLSTPVIIISFGVWPIGVVLLLMRLSKNNLRYETVEKIQLILGILLILFGVLGTIIYLSDGTPQYIIIAVLLFLLPGGLLTFFGNKRRKNLKIYNEYLKYINVRKKIKLDSLSEKLNVDYDTSVNVLTEMINLGLIDGYLNDDELIINGKSKGQDEEIEKKKETKIVKCKSCGAKNSLVVGETKECDYCGSLLN